MDRRHFLAASGLAAASPLLTSSPALATAAAAPAADGPAPFTRIDFAWDGLGLEPREYAAVLTEQVEAGLERDYYSLDGVVAAIEAKFAALLGKEAAVFLPSGTLANHVALRTLAGERRRVLVQAESHVYNDAGDGTGVLSGLNLVPLAAGATMFDLDEVETWLTRSAGGRVPLAIGAISVETPVRRREHAFVPFEQLQALSVLARERGVRLHLDGARLFTLPLHTGRSVQEHAALFDTVYVSLWKHFNAAAGAILAGDRAVIDGLYHQRRMFGGSLPYAWPTVAPVLKYVDTFERDYAAAWQVAEEVLAQLQASGRFTVRRVENGSSRFYLSLAGGGLDTFVTRAAGLGIALGHPPEGATELAMQVNPTLLRAPAADIATKLLAAAS